MGKHHKLSKTRLYRIWDGMKQRCYNPNNSRYKYYGERRIAMCDEWKCNFKAFYDWAMKNGYMDNLSIERIDVTGDYCPKNCCWKTSYEQSRNKRNNIYVRYNGELMCLNDASKVSGINRHTLSDRYHAGDRGERLFRPVRKYKNRKDHQ